MENNFFNIFIIRPISSLLKYSFSIPVVCPSYHHSSPFNFPLSPSHLHLLHYKNCYERWMTTKYKPYYMQYYLNAFCTDHSHPSTPNHECMEVFLYKTVSTFFTSLFYTHTHTAITIMFLPNIHKYTKFVTFIMNGGIKQACISYIKNYIHSFCISYCMFWFRWILLLTASHFIRTISTVNFPVTHCLFTDAFSIGACCLMKFAGCRRASWM